MWLVLVGAAGSFLANAASAIAGDSKQEALAPAAGGLP